MICTLPHIIPAHIFLNKVRIVLLSSMTMQKNLQWKVNFFPISYQRWLVGSFSEQWCVFSSVTEIAYFMCQDFNCNAFVIAKFWVFLPKFLCILCLSAIIFNFQGREHDRFTLWMMCMEAGEGFSYLVCEENWFATEVVVLKGKLRFSFQDFKKQNTS